MSVFGKLADKLNGRVSKDAVSFLRALGDSDVLQDITGDLTAGVSGYKVEFQFPEGFLPGLMAGRPSSFSLALTKKAEGETTHGTETAN